ncbi:transient receptor potential channel pyrexia-like isoform X2 [Bombus impatiens]|uniref:Transient receptor potential channel pyrexia-like isoform X2 n=1 Tax=Bombus impatiens TaxID=132113 RepID=A0A6P3UY02_BOMIM|nr:transient receptor potential channel pyrexia-like isoform X2 [Bombus impatiens]
MSILNNKPLLNKFLNNHNFQEGSNIMSLSSTVNNYIDDCEDIWMNDMEEDSISSEYSSEPVICHIKERQITNQQPWNTEEIILALSDLPAGKHALSVIPTLHGDILDKVLHEFLNTDDSKLSVNIQKTATSSFSTGCIQNTLLNIENEAALNTTALQLFLRWPNTCLLVSCYLGHVNVVKALLKSKNANISARDSDGRTPLHLAACTASLTILEELLQHGANPCEWDFGKKYTPLHYAAATGDLACVKCLIKSQADVNAGIHGKSPLYYAVLNNAADCVKALLEAGASPNNPQVYTETPLHVAAGLGSVMCTKLLLTYGADVRFRFGSMKSTPLHLAAEEGSAECTKLLLDAGAECEAKNARGQTPMHLAVLSQSMETLDVLLNIGAKVNIEDNDGRTPLHAAVTKSARGIELVKILLQAGALVNKADKFGYTPLHIAALNENSPTVIMLLSKGADLTARTKGGISALSFIVRRTPDVLPRFISRLDQAISLHDHELGDVDCELRLDFRPLVSGGRGETNLMLCLVESGQRHILKHPLCESFLYLKWLRIRKFFLLSLIFHSIFVAFFTAYIVVEKFRGIVFWPVLIFTITIAGKEFFQMAHGMCSYIKRWENWLQWSVVLLSSIVLNMPKHCPGWQCHGWQHHIAAVSILLIWIVLMMVVGKFPMFGLYIQMFTQVSINFFKFLGAYIFLIIGFSLGFNVLLKNDSFKYPLIALLKSIVMMSGELEFEDIFISTEAPIEYSVSDIQELRRCAGLDGLVRRAELVAHLEHMLFSKFLDHAPNAIMKACRRGALLLHPPHYCAIYIRPNDPREKRLPQELIKAIYRLVIERKHRNVKTKGTSIYNAYSIGMDTSRLNRLYSSTSSDNNQQLNELATELKRCSFNIATRLDRLTNKVESILRESNNSI